jgi:hypothetical protein
MYNLGVTANTNTSPRSQIEGVHLNYGQRHRSTSPTYRTGIPYAKSSRYEYSHPSHHKRNINSPFPYRCPQWRDIPASSSGFLCLRPTRCMYLSVFQLWTSRSTCTLADPAQRLNNGQTISTPLFTQESTLEFTTRIAKLLARKTGKPVYVGNSISFASAGMGGTVEEEMEGFKKVVEVVMGEVTKPPTTNGINGY